VPVPLANGDAAAVEVPVAGGTSTTRAEADVVAVEDEGIEMAGVVEYHEDRTKNKHHKRDISHLRHCYLALALSTPTMNFSGHGRPLTIDVGDVLRSWMNSTVVVRGLRHRQRLFLAFAQR
jgi:hypothetical protein